MTQDLIEWSANLPHNTALTYALGMVKSDTYGFCEVFVIGHDTHDAIDRRDDMYRHTEEAPEGTAFINADNNDT